MARKKSFEVFYKEQLIRLRKKVSPLGCLSDLNSLKTIEEISKKFDEFIEIIGK